MDILKLQEKIEKEMNDKKIAENYAKALYNSPEDFWEIVVAWTNGEEREYFLNDISLQMIREKENCSYLKALLRMQILIEEPTLAAGYKDWKPVNKDWGREDEACSYSHKQNLIANLFTTKKLKK
jgi:hypothetical protein